VVEVTNSAKVKGHVAQFQYNGCFSAYHDVMVSENIVLEAR